MVVVMVTVIVFVFVNAVVAVALLAAAMSCDNSWYTDARELLQLGGTTHLRPHLFYACFVVSRVTIVCYIIRHD